jgi:hypothetical protein
MGRSPNTKRLLCLSAATAAAAAFSLAGLLAGAGA